MPLNETDATFGGEPESKRRRVNEDAEIKITENVNGETVIIRKEPMLLLSKDPELHFLQFLTWEELNEFACVSKHSQEARAHASLNQKREGTIRIPKGTNLTHIEFCQRLHSWDNIFQGNRTNLRLEGLNHLLLQEGESKNNRDFRWDSVDAEPPPPPPPLSEVKSAILSGSEYTPWPLDQYLSRLPKLEILEVGPVQIPKNFFLDNAESCSRLRSIRFTDAVGGFCGIDFAGICIAGRKLLRELYLDSTSMSVIDTESPELFEVVRHRLVRVSLKGVQYSWFGPEGTYRPPVPPSQDHLIDFVRNAPNLRWFRSDLSEKNIAMLQEERPDVTFAA